MLQYPSDHGQILNRSHQAQPSTTVIASEDIEQKNSAEKISPREMRGRV